MTTPHYETIIFDIDDTLIQYSITEQNAFEKTMKDFKIPIDESLPGLFREVTTNAWMLLNMESTNEPFIQENYHKLYHDFIDSRFTLWKKYITTDTEANLLSERFLQYFCSEEAWIGSIKEVIKELYQTTTLLIGSNGLTSIQKPRVEELESYFKNIYVSEDVGYIKPSAAFFDAIVKEEGITDRRKVLMVGDSLNNDILGAYLAGLDTCWVNPEHKKNNSNVVPTFEVERADELKKILNSFEQ